MADGVGVEDGAIYHPHVLVLSSILVQNGDGYCAATGVRVHDELSVLAEYWLCEKCADLVASIEGDKAVEPELGQRATGVAVGGAVIAVGTPEQVAEVSESYTGRFLGGMLA